MRAVKWNSSWKFWEDKDAFSLVWSVPENAETVDLPHDAMLQKDAWEGSPNGGNTGYRDGGSYVYYKELLAPPEWENQTVTLKFEGVYQEAKVYVNSQLAASCAYGYSTFYVPLNDYLRYGENNIIRVLVRTGDMPNSRWYSGSGIYRDVYLMTGGLCHIGHTGPRVSTAELNEDALLLVETPLNNRSHRPASLTLRTEILDDLGAVVAVDQVLVFLPGGGSEILSQRIPVSEPRLWSAETPSLYTVRTALICGDDLVDEAEDRFGIRSLSLDTKRGLRVNGEPVKLRGACIHHDSGLLGAATYLDAEYRRVRLLKEAGFNAIRCAHNPAAPALLRACDELGMYVMEEAFDMWTRAKSDHDYSRHFPTDWKKDLRAMAEKDWGHPSVILYSLGNEIPEIATEHGAALQREMYRFLRDMDSTRYILSSINGVFASGDQMGAIMADILAAEQNAEGNVNNFMQAMDTRMDAIVTHPLVSENLEKASAGMDLVGYNYMTARYEPDARDYPNRVIVGSETYPPEIARNWEIITRQNNVIGDFTWTGWDYLGEAGVGVPAYAFGEGGFGAKFPCQLAFAGDLDITGFRRPQSYYREIVFGLRKDPYIAVQNPERYGQELIKTPWVLSDSISTWTYPGFEGKPVIVEVYAPGDRVELLLNGKPVGEAAPQGCIARFEIVYDPGTLEAVAFQGEAELGRMTLTTAQSGETVLRMESENGAELIYVPVTLTDPAGIVIPETQTLTCTVTGDADLIGFGSGDPKPKYNYTGNVTETWNGRALAILRKTGEHGAAQIAVNGDVCTEEITIDW